MYPDVKTVETCIDCITEINWSRQDYFFLRHLRLRRSVEIRSNSHFEGFCECPLFVPIWDDSDIRTSYFMAVSCFSRAARSSALSFFTESVAFSNADIFTMLRTSGFQAETSFCVVAWSLPLSRCRRTKDCSEITTADFAVLKITSSPKFLTNSAVVFTSSSGYSTVVCL